MDVLSGSESSDESDSALFEEGPPVSDNATKEEFQEALKASQLQCGKLLQMVRQLQLENKVLAAKQPKGRRRDMPNELALQAERITALGKEYCVMRRPWVPAAAFCQPRPSAFQLRGSNPMPEIILELYDFVPNNLHDMMENHSQFGDLFRKGTNNVRSTQISRLRATAGALYDLPAHWFQTQYNRAGEPKLEALLKFDITNRKYPRLAPILYPDLKAKKTKIFRNPVLLKILKVMLLGPQSLESTKHAKPKTYGEKWNITSITPGAIAFSAIIARFLASPDSDFTPKGSKSGIDYEGDFNSYRKVLITLQEKNQIKELFDLYNGFIFSNKPVETLQELSEEEEDEMAALMRAFDGADSDSDPGADVQPISIASSLGRPTTSLNVDDNSLHGSVTPSLTIPSQETNASSDAAYASGASLGSPVVSSEAASGAAIETVKKTRAKKPSSSAQKDKDKGKARADSAAAPAPRRTTRTASNSKP